MIKEGEEARTNQRLEIEAAMSQVGHALMGRRELSVDVAGFSVRGPRTTEEDMLLTLRGIDGEGTPVVAFFGGPNLGVLFISIENMLRNGTVNWRIDEYRNK